MILRASAVLLASLPLLIACGESDPAAGGGTGGLPAATGGTGGGAATGGAGGEVGIPDEAPTALEAAAAMGKGFNLGQMFENTQHSPTLAAAQPKIDAYYDRGHRNVRIPITWMEAVQGDTLADPMTGEINRAHPRLAELTSVIDYALSKPGLYVVINAHHEKTLKDSANGVVFEKLWADIVDIYGDRSGRLVFEFLNEPHLSDDSAMDPANVRFLSAVAYNQVRARNPARIVMIGGNQWFSAQEVPTVWTTLDDVGGGTDPYVMATFHHYNPWTFCGDNQGDYADPWTDAHVADPIGTMKAWSETVGGGMPVYIGEWGVGWGSRYGKLFDCNNIRQFYTQLQGEATTSGQPTAVWDDGGWFMIWDHATNAYNNNLMDCIDGSCEWNGTERFNVGCE